MLKGNSFDHLLYFLKKIKNKEPFSFIRPNDGEYMIVNGTHFKTQDIWKFNGGILQKELLQSIQSCKDISNCYVGIPCKSCWGGEMTSWCIDNYNIDINRLTYGNIVCNYNWKYFTNFMISNKIPFYYIGPGTNKSESLNIIDRLYTDPFQIERWDSENEIFKKTVFDWVENKINLSSESLIFCFAVGPLTKILISYLAKKYPSHSFFDTGSSLDLFMKGNTNRGYINNNNTYANIICDFDKGHLTHNDIVNNNKTDITAILTIYKRPHVILEQIEAIKNQTVPPKKIIVYVNYAEGYDVPTSLRNDKSIIFIESNTNLGVWARFAIGLLANTEYICIFDDDTIPGKKWFENCLNSINKVNGLLGTVGVNLVSNPDKYIIHGQRYGWPSPNNDIVKVDIVGHSWFFRREWLKYLWETTPDYDTFLRIGEDIGFSWALQKHGINTYVPPHPSYDIEMFGSIPDKAWKYGTENVAIYLNNPNFNLAFKFYRQKGFRLIND